MRIGGRRPIGFERLFSGWCCRGERGKQEETGEEEEERMAYAQAAQPICLLLRGLPFSFSFSLFSPSNTHNQSFTDGESARVRPSGNLVRLSSRKISGISATFARGAPLRKLRTQFVSSFFVMHMLNLIINAEEIALICSIEMWYVRSQSVREMGVC